MKEDNLFAGYTYEELPWIYIGYTSGIIKSDITTDEEKVMELKEAKRHFNERWSDLTNNELST